ncbi:hypothetical protein [Hydrotalea sp.]|uniref:hypothetical protein n=1 Tax=Hydrotalea sp. TaxID=2881279 RepID=UPI003D0F2C9D
MKHLFVKILCLIVGFTLSAANAESANFNSTTFSIDKKMEKAFIPKFNNTNASYYDSRHMNLEPNANSDCIEVHFSCGPVATICGYEGDLGTLIEALLIVDDIICP